MNRTKIEWVKNPDGTQGYTWNPITGCLNHVNGMCKGGNFPCYAYRLAQGRLFQRYISNGNTAPVFSDGKGISTEMPDTFDPFYPRFWPERLSEPITKYSEWGRDRVIKHRQSQKGIFVCDMSDLFGIGIPEEWTREVLNTIRLSPEHRFYLLTKQPQHLPKWSPFPENCWVGVTATDGHRFVDALNNLIHVKASVQFISLEPLLNWHIPSWLVETNLKSQPEIKWLIIGAQTKPYKPPKIEWVQEIVEAADRAGVKVFLKDNLRPLLKHEFPFVNYRSMTQPEGELRQELPK
jgi:protein gp37